MSTCAYHNNCQFWSHPDVKFCHRNSFNNWNMLSIIKLIMIMIMMQFAILIVDPVDNHLTMFMCGLYRYNWGNKEDLNYSKVMTLLRIMVRVNDMMEFIALPFCNLSNSIARVNFEMSELNILHNVKLKPLNPHFLF